MRVCLIAVEIFAWGKYGGFGRATRMLGRELAKRGIDVCAVVPRRTLQQPEDRLDGIRVLSFPAHAPWQARALFQACDADIYHSQEPSLSTWVAQQAMPQRKHVVTCRDPKTLRDRLIELRYPSISALKTIAAVMYENNALVSQAVRRADACFCCAHGLSSRAQTVYGLSQPPGVLASPIEIPKQPMRKSPNPTACFIARWDKRKRPELFFKLAEQFPRVRFIAAGKAQDKSWDAQLRNTYGALPNVEMRGFVDQFSSNALSGILEQSWILVNTSAREGLPTSFLEAMAHRCAILSSVNPDEVTERFGYYVRQGNFAEGLRQLLDKDAWKAKGEAGFCYVRDNHALEKVMEQHLALYRGLLGNSAATG